MRMSSHFSRFRSPFAMVLAVSIVTLLATAIVKTATNNYVAKYNSGGTLVDSAIYEASGKVGIGTTSPSAKLQINASTITSPWSSYGEFAILHNVATVPANSQEMFGGIFIGRDKASALAAGDALGGINFGAGPDVNEVRAGYAAIGAIAGSNHNARLAFYTAGSSSNVPVERMRVDESGNVGIGTNSPSSRLHVSGDVTVSGNIAAKYQDVAEWVPSRGPATSGTVMVISSSDGDTNVLSASQSQYDTAVAGVVSEQPGITLGEKGQGKAIVAHTGRVRVKVDASYGAIRAGDLLVTSDTPGFAMLSRPVDAGGAKFHRPGTIIGKALEPLSSGRGTILVLLALQ